MTAVVNHVGAGVFCVRLRVKRGETLAAFIRFSSPDSDESKGAPRLAVRGRVLRVDKLPGDVYGSAVRMLAHRFIYQFYHPRLIGDPAFNATTAGT